MGGEMRGRDGRRDEGERWAERWGGEMGGEMRGRDGRRDEGERWAERWGGEMGRDGRRDGEGGRRDGEGGRRDGGREMGGEMGGVFKKKQARHYLCTGCILLRCCPTLNRELCCFVKRCKRRCPTD